MWYILVIILVLFVGFLLLRLRFRLELSDTRRLLFFGIGRSGAEIDFIDDVTRIKLMGLTVTTLNAPSNESKPNDSESAIRAVKLGKEKLPDSKRPKGKSTRANALEWLKIGLNVFHALRQYVVELYRSIRVEIACAEIRAGFESPDMTGQTFGYYHALIGAIPSLAPRLQFYPDWMGQSFSGSARLSIAIPMYALFGRTLVFLYRLPLLKIMRMARNQRKGAAYAN